MQQKKAGVYIIFQTRQLAWFRATDECGGVSDLEVSCAAPTTTTVPDTTTVPPTSLYYNKLLLITYKLYSGFPIIVAVLLKNPPQL